MSNTTSRYEDILGLSPGSWFYSEKPTVEERLAEHLTFIADVDLSEPDYSFDLLRIYVRKSDGAILYATDSGCSCPSPFEDTTIGEFSETNIAGIERAAREAASGSYGYSEVQVAQEVRDLMPKMREAGAR